MVLRSVPALGEVSTLQQCVPILEVFASSQEGRRQFTAHG